MVTGCKGFILTQNLCAHSPEKGLQKTPIFTQWHKVASVPVKWWCTIAQLAESTIDLFLPCFCLTSCMWCWRGLVSYADSSLHVVFCFVLLFFALDVSKSCRFTESTTGSDVCMFSFILVSKPILLLLKNPAVSWLLYGISRRWIDIRFHPWGNPLRLTWLKAPTNLLTNKILLSRCMLL